MRKSVLASCRSQQWGAVHFSLSSLSPFTTKMCSRIKQDVLFLKIYITPLLPPRPNLAADNKSNYYYNFKK